MSSRGIVVRVRYKHSFENGKHISKWVDYVSKKEKADSMSLDEENIMNEYFSLADKDSYLFEKCESFIWDENGDVNPKQDLNLYKDIDQTGFTWNLVVSFPPDFAMDNGLITKGDFFDLTKNFMPSLITDMGLKLDNTVWYAGLHRNTKNPHMHILLYEKKKTASTGFVPRFAVKNLKSNIGNYLIDNISFYQLRDKEFSSIVGDISLKELNKVKNQKLFSDKYRKELNNKLLKLYDELPKKGRLQYNSRNIQIYKKDIDDVIKHILMHDSIKYNYANYLRLLDRHQKELIDLYGMTDDNRNRKYYNDQLNRLYSKIGNEILHNFKIYQSIDLLEREKTFLKNHINELKFKSRNDYAKEESKIKIGKDLYKICMMAGLNSNETRKIFDRWIKNSKYDLDLDYILNMSFSLNSEMSSTEYYNALKKLGYNFDRYNKFRKKYFYRELDYKKFIKEASDHLLYEYEKEEKQIIDQLQYELDGYN